MKLTNRSNFTIEPTSESPVRKAKRKETHHDWRNRQRAMPTRFIAIDGEGITLENGEHRYVLLGIGDQQISNPNGLSFGDCLEFLWEEFDKTTERKTAYGGFFLAYDFIQWFKTLPEERARMMLTKEGKDKRQPKNANRSKRGPFPVQYEQWEFDILGTKRFKFRLRNPCGQPNPWMNICDTGSFFQKSFLKVIDPTEWSDPVVTAEEYAIILEGKSKRASAVLDKDMRRYNALENNILPRVLAQLDAGFQQLGINLKPSQWFGPGQAAQAWLSSRAITSTRLGEVTPSAVLEAARKSYFGGWFEIMAHGIIPGQSWEYDINSAYPYIISTLPCLEHGEWIHNASLINTTSMSSMALVYARIGGSDSYIGAMLHRDAKGNIYRPHKTEGWYWLHEIQAAQRAGVVSHASIAESWCYFPCDCPKPLREVRDIYALRKQVGKKTPLGIACKLVPNSLYGKFAQSVGFPKYGNPIYASLITAGCRTMILDAIATHPKGTQDVIMVATDGVYFRTEHPDLPVSESLGDWDQDTKGNLCLFKPGVYWDDSTRKQMEAGTTPVFKARGISAKAFGSQLKRIEEAFRDMEAYRATEGFPVVTFPLEFSMITAVQALMRNDWSQAGALTPDPTAKQSASPFLKRSDCYWEGTWHKDRILRSRPKPNDPYEPSHPYEKRFGMEDPFSQENTESYGITPDGLPAMLWREGLGM